MALYGRTDAGLSLSGRTRHRLLPPLATGLGYYLGAKLGVVATAMSEGIAIFWLPNGILLAALLLAPRRDWPLYLLAAMAAEIVADPPTFTLTQALGFAAVNLFECLLAAWLLQRVARPFALDRLRHVGLFAVYAPLLACGLAALMGASIYALSFPTATPFWSFWMIWWLGDGMGVMLITPFLLGWMGSPPRPVEGRALEAMALLTLTLLLTLWIFSQAATDDFPRRPFLLFPLPLWAAARFGVRGAVGIAVLIAVIAIMATLNGVSPLLAATPADTVLLLQEYLAVLIFSSLALAALLNESRTARDAHNSLNRELEARVAARTQDLQSANQHLAELASIDPLTGASNRRHFMAESRIELSRAKRQDRPLSVIMLDVDYFKSINDRFGHETGDKALVALAATIHATLRGGDIFARMGGEEFIVMLPGQGLTDAFQTAERLRLLIAQSVIPDCPDRITISAGVAELENALEEIDELLRRADQALYRAKNQGRNKVCLGQGTASEQPAGK